MLANVRINRRAVERIEAGHPWVFTSDVLNSGNAEPGSVVRVADHTGRTPRSSVTQTARTPCFLVIALYRPVSPVPTPIIQ